MEVLLSCYFLISRATCTTCHCSFDKHAITDSSKDSYLHEMELSDTVLLKAYDAAQTIAKEHGLVWLPIGIQASDVCYLFSVVISASKLHFISSLISGNKLQGWSSHFVHIAIVNVQEVDCD